MATKTPSVNKAQLAELGSTIQKIKKGFGKAIVVRQSIDKSTFIRDYLPVFSGDVRDPETVRRCVHEWINRYAGDTTTPVHVVEDGTLNVVVVVPMLKARDMFNTTVGEQVPLIGAIRNANRLSNVNPVLGNNKMNTALTNAAKTWVGSAKTANRALSEEWATLFTYFGVNKASEEKELPKDEILTDGIERD